MSKQQQPTRKKWLKRAAIAVAIYTVFGFLVLPAIIKWQMLKQLPALTHRAARVESVRVNPYALSLGVRGLALTEPDGSTFASFSNFYVNFEAWSSLFNWTWTLSEVRLGSPYGYVSVLTNGKFNFANLLTNAPSTNAAAGGAKPLPPLLVQRIEITNGTVAVADFYRTVPFQTRFTPIDVRLTNFTSRPRTGSPYAFTASTGEGEYFSWAGSVEAFPPASAGKFELGGIDLKKYGTYAHEFAQLDVRDGKVTVGATYSFALETNGIQLTVTNASVRATNLAVFAPGPDGTNALVKIPSIVVRGAEANLQKRTAKVQSVATSGGSILARRFHDGTLELLALAMPPSNRPPTLLNPPVSTKPAPPPAAAPVAPWSVVVEDISVQDYTAQVIDEQPPKPATLLADQVALSVKGLSLASNAPVHVVLSARVNSTGTAKVDAQGTVLPVAMDVDLDVSAIDLPPFQPYVEQQQVKLAFTSGNVSTKGRASVALAALGESNQLAAKFAGDVVLNDVAIVDQIAFQDFAKWKQVAVRGIDFTLSPMSVKVHEVACDSFAASAVMGTNMQLTALAVLPPAPTNPAPVAPKPPSPDGALLPFPVQLDVLALTNTSLHLVDLSVQPNCRFDVQEFSGTVRGLSSSLNSAADVYIHGRMNESAPFSVFGKINPLVRDLFVDLVITNKNTELTAFTPYMEKFGGHELKKGKFTVGLRANLNKGALDSETVVFVDQLTLGPHNTSPDAIKLPVKLGVALLKDRNGRIELDVPVRGRLDDPKFGIWPIAWQVIENLLIKAATSPFALLGALVGGGEELSFVEFPSGQSVIPTNEFVKIDKLGKALFERPALNLEITGAADDSLDRASLAWLKLERDLKTARFAELEGKTGAPTSSEAVKLEPRDYERLLKAHYKKTFNRDQPLAVAVTNALTGAVTNIALPVLRNEPRHAGEAQLSHPARSSSKDTNAVATTDPRLVTRPVSLPALSADIEVLAAMESELCAQAQVTPEDLRELMQARAQSVQRALLATEKVTAERLFILAPKAADPASKGQSRVNLSLN